MEVQNFYQGYSPGWAWVTKHETVRLSGRCYARLIREAQRDYLDGYAFDWSQWRATVILNEDITAQIEWENVTTGAELTLTCIHFDRKSGAILQAGSNYGRLTL